MNMNKLIKFLSLSICNPSFFSKEADKNIKSNFIVKKENINFGKDNIPEDLKLKIKRKYKHLNEQQQLNKSYFMWIIYDYFLKSEFFLKIKDEFEKSEKTGDFYHNYYLLLSLIKKNIITDTDEVINQEYKIALLENTAKFKLNIILLKNINEGDFETIRKFIEEQQSKDFKLTNTTVAKYNNFIKGQKKKEFKSMTIDEVLLEGEYMNFINLPKEFLALENLLKKYYIWFTWQKRSENSYEIGLIKGIEKLPAITRESFIKNLQNKLILKEILKIISNKTNVTYKINNKLPLEVLDEEILEYLSK